MLEKVKNTSGHESITIFGQLENNMSKVERKAKTSLIIIHFKKQRETNFVNSGAIKLLEPFQSQREEIE